MPAGPHARLDRSGDAGAGSVLAALVCVAAAWLAVFRLDRQPAARLDHDVRVRCEAAGAFHSRPRS